MFSQSLIEKFWAHVDRRGPDECWNWLGSLRGGRGTGNGYGQFHIADCLKIGAHRFAYIITFGPIPPGMQIHHKCENRACVNPAHLEALNPWDHARADAALGNYQRGGPDGGSAGE